MTLFLQPLTGPLLLFAAMFLSPTAGTRQESLRAGRSGVIQQILRHAHLSTTATYFLKTVPAQLTDAIEKLQQALPEILSGNEGAAEAIHATAFPAVN